MRRLVSVALVALMLMGVTAAWADESQPAKASPQEVAATKSLNEVIVAKVEGASGVFSVQDDGSVRHVQSGMVCPAKYPSVDFYQVFVYAKDGSDVGCDYRRADDRGGAWAKLSLFATRLVPGMTLDRAFAGYHNEIVRTYPDAKSLGPALRAKDSDTASPLPPIQSEEFFLPLNGTTYTSQLYVALQAGWMIEIRATFVGEPNKIEVTKEGGTGAAELALGARLMGAKALFDALGSIGK